MNHEYRYEGFAELDEAGFISEYHQIDNKEGVVRPSFSLEHIINSGFLGKGKRVCYLNRNGYDSQREYAARQGLTEGMVLTVKRCSVGSCSSEYTFYEVNGSYNTVMFEEVIDVD